MLDGYVTIDVDKIKHYAHHWAWFYEKGIFPNTELDHKDGNPSNNQIYNLRKATSQQNKANAKKCKRNTTGFKGVIKRPFNRYQASIAGHHLGYYASAKEAHLAYLAEAVKRYGHFARAS